MIRRIALICLVASSALLIAALANAARYIYVSDLPTTFGDQFQNAGAVVIARLLGTPQRPAIDPDEPSEPLKSRFEIIEVLKGKDALGDTRELETLCLGDHPPGTQFLVHASRAPELAWGTPWGLNDSALEYVRRVAKLPDSTDERLRFFLEHLQASDELVSRDALRELHRVAYRDLTSLRDSLDSDRLITLITDARTNGSFRRLYLTLLSIAEQPAPRAEVIDMLEARLMAPACEESRAWRDAEITCYLTLKGSDGLPLIEERFLKNQDRNFSDTYAAIMALRFHGNEELIIPKERLLIALRLLLDRPDVADLVIPDLARWQDWSVIDRLVTLFKQADDKSQWVRVPVILYLQACPLPEAANLIDELAQIDPKAVERANAFDPFNVTAKASPTPSDDTTDQAPRDKPAPEDGTSGEGT